MSEAETHVVEVPCNCGDVEHCAMERYIADVRTAFDEIERLSTMLNTVAVAA